jgi:glutamate carboxypeptidase
MEKYFNHDTARKISSYLDTHLDRYLDLLREMVGINSFTQNQAGVNRLGDRTAEAFAGLGFSAERVQSVMPSYGSHLVLSLQGIEDRRLGCVSHLDTVFSPEEEELNDFKWRVKGDRIYGPGTSDIKGGTVVMLMTLEAIRHAAPDLFAGLSWVLLFDASEEMESDDFGSLCRERLGDRASGCLVFEAGAIRNSKFSLVSSRKGRAEFRITATGKGAHSGVAHRKGASAIRQIAEVIKKFEDITDYANNLTVNVGRITGGSQINRVPHHAEALAEMRAFSPEVFEAALADILALDGYSSVSSNDGNFSCHTAVRLLRRVPAWPDNPGSDRLMRYWRSAAELLGGGIVQEKRGGLSDGNFTWERIPTIDGLGPTGGNPHCSEASLDGSKEQEYTRASSFAPKGLLNAMALILMAESE